MELREVLVESRFVNVIVKYINVWSTLYVFPGLDFNSCEKSIFFIYKIVKVQCCSTLTL